MITAVSLLKRSIERHHPSAMALLVALMTVGCTPKTLNKEALYTRQYYREHGAPIFHMLEAGNVRIRYTERGTHGSPVVLFLHGTPGGWSAFARYLNDETLQASARLVAVDRPGWGGSPLPGGGVIPGLEKQAEALHPLLQRLAQDDPNRRIMLVGHSLGASLAARMAMTYPHLIDGLVLISGSLDPELGRPRWFNHVAAVPGLRWLIAKISRGMGNANLEIMPLHDELAAMLPLWRTLHIPITVIQGGKDDLVFPGNADFAHRVIPQQWLTLVRVPKLGHFIVWQQHTMVRQRILDTLTRTQPDPVTTLPASADPSTSPTGAREQKTPGSTEVAPRGEHQYVTSEHQG